MKFNPKKSLSQNFLTDKNILKKIVDVGNISGKDEILEIGPGTGNLTGYIIKCKPKHIIVVEKDIELIKILESKFKKEIRIVNEDVLKLTQDFYYDKFIVYGNLPYNISTKILSNWCLSKEIRFKKLVLMFQKEVADRIVAKVNTKNYSRITVLANWKFNIKKIFDISPECFFPKPKIKSTLLIFTHKNKIFRFNNPQTLEKVTRVFFNQRRKKIKKQFNSLFYKNLEISNKLNIDLNLRPQNLTPEHYFNLAQELEKL